jgi:hypothetical protein
MRKDDDRGAGDDGGGDNGGKGGKGGVMEAKFSKVKSEKI